MPKIVFSATTFPETISALYCFVLLHEAMNKDLAEIDIIDKQLDCVSLRWQHNCGDNIQFASSREFGPVPAETIRALVHVVPKGSYFSKIDVKGYRAVNARTKLESQQH